MSADRVAAAAARRAATAAAGDGGSDPASDPFAAAQNRILDSRAAGGWTFGFVIDAVMGGHVYRVSTGDSGIIYASPGSPGGFGAVGGRSLDTYPPYTPVWVVRHPETPHLGTIVLAEAAPAYSRENQPADQIWPPFRTGHNADEAHREPAMAALRLAEAAGIPPNAGGLDLWDTGGGRPTDSTTAGERGWMHETGVSVFSDSWHAGLRVDEHTGVWAFYPDQLLRLAGVATQLWTSASEWEERDDEGELYSVRKKYVYPHEAAGLNRWNQATTRPTPPPPPTPDGEDVPAFAPGGQGVTYCPPESVQEGSGWAASESDRADAVGVARGYEFAGYLGQGGRDLLAVPVQFSTAYPDAKEWLDQYGATYFTPEEAAQANLLEDTHYFLDDAGEAMADSDGYPNEPEEVRVPVHTLRSPGGFQPGVATQNRSLPGALRWASAKEIVLAKRPSVPTPRQRRRPNDPNGDARGTASEGYQPSGLNPPDWEDGPFDAETWADHHKVVDSLPGFDPHRASAGIADVLAYAFNWEGLHPFEYHEEDWEVPDEGLAGSPLVNQAVPAFARLACAQHLKDPPPVHLDIDHRYTEAAYYQTEAVIAMLEDGSIHVHNGYGAEVKLLNGHVTIDAPGDVRIGAGRNIFLQAGHDVVIRARDSVDITTSAHDVRILANKNFHTVSGAGGCGGTVLENQAVCPGYAFTDRVGEEVDSSGIMMIAPNAQVVSMSRDAVTMALSGKIVHDAGPAGTVRSIGNRHHQVVYGSAVQAFVDDGGVSVVNEYTSSGTLFGAGLDVDGPVVATGDVDTATAAQAASIATRETNLAAYADALLDTPSVPPDALLAEFTLRSDEQYMTYDWTLWRPRWMTLAEESGQVMPVWDEPLRESSVQGFAQYPFPGGAWTDPAAFLTSPPFLSDPDRGWVAVPRKGRDNWGAWENPTPPPVVGYAMSDAYLVVVPPDPGASYCGSNATPPVGEGSFEATLAGGWGWPNQGEEDNLDARVVSGSWTEPISPPPPPPPGPAGPVT